MPTLNPYQTPRPTKDPIPEIDFHLTSSREMDRKYRHIFTTEKQEKTENREFIGKNLVDRSIQIHEGVERGVEGAKESVGDKGRHKQELQGYIETMNTALGKRQQKEKHRLRNMLKTKRISNKSYKHKKQALEKWVDSKRSQIQKTKNLLFQGWMKANEMIGNLEKDKSDVFRRLEAKRGGLSPTSQSSNFSAISFCRSDNSVGSINMSNITNSTKPNMNATYDFDGCSKLRLKNRPRPTH